MLNAEMTSNVTLSKAEQTNQYAAFKRGSSLILSWVLPSPSLGDGLNTGPTSLWIDNSEMAAVVEMVFIYN